MLKYAINDIRLFYENDLRFWSSLNEITTEWVRQYVNVKAKPEKLALALTMSGLEVESIEHVEEYIFEIGVTPNRGDCLSIMGVAREISAAFGLPLKPPSFAFTKGKGEMAGA